MAGTQYEQGYDASQQTVGQKKPECPHTSGTPESVERHLGFSDEILGWERNERPVRACDKPKSKEVNLGNFEVVGGTEGPQGDPYGFTEVTVRLSEQEVIKAHCGLRMYVHHTLKGNPSTTFNHNFNKFEDFDKKFIELTGDSFSSYECKHLQ